jgi:hypothetical protein
LRNTSEMFRFRFTSLARVLSASMLAFSVLVVGGSSPMAAGCGEDDGSGTTGKRIALEVKIAASSDSKQFTNTQGWAIAITKADIATGALYFYDGATLFASGPESRPPATTRSFVKTAHAHPGHYVPGNAKGEMRSSTSADVLAGALLGKGDGITGPVRSATFTFGAPGVGPVAADLGANVIVMEGTATKGAESRIFRAEILPADVKDAKGVTQIEGCPFAETDMQGDGVVTLTIKLPMWFEQVVFDAVPASTDGKPVLLTDGLARNQLVRGTKAGLSYSFAYAPR